MRACWASTMLRRVPWYASRLSAAGDGAEGDADAMRLGLRQQALLSQLGDIETAGIAFAAEEEKKPIKIENLEYEKDEN